MEFGDQSDPAVVAEEAAAEDEEPVVSLAAEALSQEALALVRAAKARGLTPEE